MKDGKFKVSDYERPIVASFIVKERHGSTEAEMGGWSCVYYRVVRLKSNRLRAESGYCELDNSPRFSRCELNGVLEEFEKKDEVKEDKERSWARYQETKKDKVNMPNEILEEIKSLVLLKDL